MIDINNKPIKIYITKYMELQLKITSQIIMLVVESNVYASVNISSDIHKEQNEKHV